MIQLSKNNRFNVLYTLAKGFGTLPEDKRVALCFPIQRMPMGLVEHTAIFFSIADDVNQGIFIIQELQVKIYSCLFVHS